MFQCILLQKCYFYAVVIPESIQFSYISLVYFSILSCFFENQGEPVGTNRLTLCFENEYIRFIIKIFSTGYNALQIQRVTIKKG